MKVKRAKKTKPFSRPMTYRLGKEDTMEGVLPTIKKHDAFLVGGILMRTIAFWGRGSQRAWEKGTFPFPKP